MVIERDGVSVSGHVTWLCICDCGNETVTRSHRLLAGTTRSCGCYGKEMVVKANSKRPGEASFNQLYGTYKRSAKYRKHEFNLTKDEFRRLTSQNCHYCNSEPTQISKKLKYNGYYTYNGIDRIDNNIGYIFDNCVPCCSQCNYAKKDVEYDEFVSWIHMVSHNLKHKKRKNHG